MVSSMLSFQIVDPLVRCLDSFDECSPAFQKYEWNFHLKMLYLVPKYEIGIWNEAGSTMKITITRASEKDLPRILEVQRMAFHQEAEDFDDYNIEPMRQTLDDLEAEYRTFTYLIALNEAGNIIGSTRGFIRSGTSYIGKTFVLPKYQRQGIGTRLIAELERINKAPRYEINASKRIPKNIALYENLGYKQFKETKTNNNTFVYLQKFS